MLRFCLSFHPTLAKGPLGFGTHPPYMKGMRTILYSIALAGLIATSVLAQSTFAPVSANSIVLADLYLKKRIVVVFADTEADPAFIHQMDMLRINAADLEDRDVVLITDTDPETPSELRLKLRPNGFSLVIMDKDGSNSLRKPRPWSTREIVRVIDKFPSRRDEMQERLPAGR